MLADDPVAAERELRRAYDSLSAVGEKFILSTAAGLLGQMQYAFGRVDEAEQLGLETKALATEDDVDAQMRSGVACCRRSQRDEASSTAARTLVREALDILEPTDAVLLKYGALLDLAEVLRLARGARRRLGQRSWEQRVWPSRRGARSCRAPRTRCSRRSTNPSSRSR